MVFRFEGISFVSWLDASDSEIVVKWKSPLQIATPFLVQRHVESNVDVQSRLIIFLGLGRNRTGVFVFGVGAIMD
jgi:hypothetical protein